MWSLPVRGTLGEPLVRNLFITLCEHFVITTSLGYCDRIVGLPTLDVRLNLLFNLLVFQLLPLRILTKLIQLADVPTNLTSWRSNHYNLGRNFGSKRWRSNYSKLGLVRNRFVTLCHHFVTTTPSGYWGRTFGSKSIYNSVWTLCDHYPFGVLWQNCWPSNY